jgi:hypothetical protein
VADRSLGGGLVFRTARIPSDEKVHRGIVVIRRVSRFFGSYGQLWFTDAALVYTPWRGELRDKVRRFEHASLRHYSLGRGGFAGFGVQWLLSRPTLTLRLRDGDYQTFWGLMGDDLEMYARRWIPVAEHGANQD